MGFISPSKIQETALPLLLADPPYNVIAQSQSGTGKTAAFVLAMLSRIDISKPHPQAICLSPTYELCLQTGRVVQEMSQFCPDIKMKFAVRGIEVSRGEKITEHIIMETPGKVLDWGTKFRCFDLKLIQVFILDEADVMIALQGHRDQSIRIHKRLSGNCQMMLFSATYDEEVTELAELIIPSPVTIRLKREEETLDNIKQYYMKCNGFHEKYCALSNVYGLVSIGQAIIFCQTRKAANCLAASLDDDGHAVGMLSGELTPEQRVLVLSRFRSGKEKVLITTNVCVRGIDIEQVTLVVNFDLPMDKNRNNPDYETYLHRIGRTGRFGVAGIAINMIEGKHELNILQQIERHFDRKIVEIDPSNCEEMEAILNC